MISNVVREFHWEPAVIDRLFLDALDHHGLEYWSDNVIAMNKDIQDK